MDYLLIREKAVKFMVEHGWKKIIAKQRNYNQSLFDHTMVALDVLITLLPILKKTFEPELSEQEEQVLIASVIAHDAGKVTPEFQAYITGRNNYVSDVNRDLDEKVLKELTNQLNFEKCEEMLSAVLLHMRHERTPAKIMDRVIFDKHSNERWKTLADIVSEVDNLASCNGLFSALQYLESRFSFANYIQTSYHLVQVRGVSTTLLHKAAIDTYIDYGWAPLIHYSNGTIYIAGVRDDIKEPSVDGIENRFAKLIEEALPDNFSTLVVGNPLASMMPKPEFYDYRELRNCLKLAAGKVRRNSFQKKSERDRRKVVSNYFKLSGRKEKVTNEILNCESERIGRAQPEMCIFKFYKAALSEELLGTKVLPEVAEQYKEYVQGKAGKVTPQVVARVEYDAIFGDGAFNNLLRMSTLMPARDMVLAVDYFWQLDGSNFDLTVAKVEYLDDDRRENLLIDILMKIADKVYTSIPTEKRPKRASSVEIAKYFMFDLVHPTVFCDFEQVVREQIKAYAETKKNARKADGEHLCPICNQPFKQGTEAKADFLDNPDAHTNRAVSHGPGGKIAICNACKYERFLQQILLDSKASSIIILFPRMNIGHGSGDLLCRKARTIGDALHLRMTAANPDPDQQISPAMTWNLARKLSEVDLYHLSPQEIVELVTYRSSDKTAKANRRKLVQLLQELYEVDELTVDVLNENWATEFLTVEDALDALIRNRVYDPAASEARTEAFHLNPHMEIVCQTPHMILIPLANPIAMSNDSETNAAIRELLFTLVLGLALDCSVAVVKTGDVIAFQGGEGVAFVGNVAAVRDLVYSVSLAEKPKLGRGTPTGGRDWISLEEAEKWIEAISAAAVLANSTDYPERSNLYAILKSPTVGHILRRIEQKNETGQVYLEQFGLLEKIKEVLI